MEITLDTIFQLFSASEKQRAEAEKQRAEAEKQRAETDRLYNEKFEKLRAETERQRAEAEKQRAEAEKQRAEVEKQRAEEEKQRVEANRLYDERFEKDRAETKKIFKELSRKMGDLTDIFGLYAEAHTKERILKLFEKRNIQLRTLVMHYLERDDKGGFIYEIDFLLYNTIYAIVVEVKNKLKKEDVDEHLSRMEKCAQYPPRGTEGKMLLGAIATMVVSTEVENYAKKKGLYIIKPSGKSIKIANEPTFKHREWKVADAQ